MLDTSQAGEDADSPAGRLRGRFDQATALLEQVQAELGSARSAGGPGVDWPRLLARVEAINALLLQVIAHLEDHHR